MTTATDLVLVTGASRSGTTMLARILGNHSRILTLRELHYFGDLCDPLTGSRRLPESELRRLAAQILARHARGIWRPRPTDAEQARACSICERLPAAARNAMGVFVAVVADLAAEHGKSIACEQTPRNVFYAAELLAALPRVRLVHIVRDPRAVLASQKNRWRLRKLGARNLPSSESVRTWLNYHPLTMANLWMKATQAALRLSEHPRVRIVRFEDLAERPDAEIRALCGFLGVDYEPGMSEVPHWGSSNLPHTGAGKGIAREVIDRWQGVLGAGEIRIVERAAAPLMSRFAYPFTGREAVPARLAAAWHLAVYPLHMLGVVLANPRRAWIQLAAVLRSH